MNHNRFQKTLSALLAALMLLTVFPAASFAAGTDPAEVYEAADYDDAVRYVRKRLMARDTKILVDCPDDSFAENCYDSVCAYDPSEPFGGDYLKMSIPAVNIIPKAGDMFEIIPTYMEGTGAADEAAAEAAVSEILEELRSGDFLYKKDKANAIYTWLCDHVEPVNADNASPVHHSAYAALVPDETGRRAAVCQGFAAAFYALALSAGLESRIIVGTHDAGDGELLSHAWNIVKINKTVTDMRWYYLDAFAGSMYWKDKSRADEADGRNAYFLKPLKNGYGGYVVKYGSDATAPEVADYSFDLSYTSEFNIVTGSCGENITYTLNLGDYTLSLEGTGDMTDYTLGAAEEATYESGFLSPQDSMVLPPWLYYECPIRTVTISEGITSVGDYAFMLLPDLRSVSLPFSLTSIGAFSFAFDLSLSQVSIPQNVGTIGRMAFSGCLSIQKIFFHSASCVIDDTGSVVSDDIYEEKLTLPKQAVLICTANAQAVREYAGLYSMTCHWDVNHDNVCDDCGDNINKIGNDIRWTFDETLGLLTITGTGRMNDYRFGTTPWYYLREKIKKVVFEDKSESEQLTYVGHFALCGCTALEEVVLSNGIGTLGDQILTGSSLRELTIPATVSKVNVGICGTFYGSHISKIVFEAQTGDIIRTVIPEKICFNAAELTEVVLPAVSEIGSQAFYGCSSLEGIALPQELTDIGSGAFTGCASLKTMTLPDRIQTISNVTFKDCGSLETVTLPKGLRTIRFAAFEYCAALTDIGPLESLQVIGANAFDGCTLLPTIGPMENLQEIGNYAFSNCKSLTEIELPEGLQTIGVSAFQNCRSLIRLALPETLVSLGSHAFCNCVSIREKVVLPESITEIGSGTFWNCNSMPEIILPKGLRSIGEAVFELCESLQKILLPEGIANIRNKTFSSCKSLTAVCFRNAETAIADNAFADAKKVVFHCAEDSAPARYAQKKGIAVHAAFSEEPVDIPATCITEGKSGTRLVCSVCEIELERTEQIIPKTDHVDDDHNDVCEMCGKQGICPHDFRQSRKEPTCTKKGEIKQICEICGYNYTETELPAKGHDYSVEIKEVPVSCTEDGVTAGRKCGRCGYVDGCEAIPAAGHHMELTSPKRPANCTETGTAAVMTCSVCGYTEGGDEIPAKGHLDYEEDGICDECGKELDEGDSLRKTIRTILEWFFGTNAGKSDGTNSSAAFRFVSIVNKLWSLMKIVFA